MTHQAFDSDIARIAYRRGDAHLTPAERILSLAAGGALAYWASRSRGPTQWAAGTLGAALLMRALSGYDPVSQMVGPKPEERALARVKGWNSAAIVTKTMTVNRPPQEIYQFWRDFRNLARFTDNVESVELKGRDRARMTVKGPLGSHVSWDTVVTEDEPGRRISWETAPGADVRNAGTVTFTELPNGRGTRVKAVIAYDPPGGQLGRLVAKVARREPAVQARQELRRFKQILETGETANGHITAH